MTDKSAIELYERDARFRALAMDAVARAMDHRRADKLEEISLDNVQDVALLAVILVLKRSFDNDAELTATRIERDHYKKIAEDLIHMRPVAPLITPRVGR